MGMTKVEFMTQYRKDQEEKERQRLKELKYKAKETEYDISSYKIERSIKVEQMWRCK